MMVTVLTRMAANAAIPLELPRNTTKALPIMPADAPLDTPPVVAPQDTGPPPYYFEHGLRRVAPYNYTYNTWCKERWRGRELIDVFSSEFRDRPVEYYLAAMETGKVAVNGKKVSPHYILKNGDLVCHTIHRHEPPITADPIGIIHEDDDMIVLNKPAGVPVHPAGRYNYNSVVEIMKSERPPGFLPRPCNRLDRLTSGIMFMAKTAEAAERLGKEILQRTVRKEYVARVVGRFPDGDIVCDQPILQISPKLGLNRVRANGKAARTVFKRLAYYPPPDSPPAAEAVDGSTSLEQHDAISRASRRINTREGYSIVRCLPVTGRTHQLRVHLQYLGHPIQNDPIYANQSVWGFNLGSNDADAVQNTDEDVITRLSRMGKDEVADAVAYHDEMVDKYYKKKAEKMSGEACAVCDTPLYTDPGDQELLLWLHSLRYEDADGAWSYCSPLPVWALPPKGMAGPTQVGGMGDLLDAAKNAIVIEPF
ncbi:pseudouridine synthase [Podospora didyma]|uniref:Pseudouridine synthase n=1 Tax=Podospora didyma TaxID=330526 RepID=A0AAE0P7K7_9PEZI|nr:pseudouridine synthase [Podospora didyma]